MLLLLSGDELIGGGFLLFLAVVYVLTAVRPIRVPKGTSGDVVNVTSHAWVARKMRARWAINLVPNTPVGCKLVGGLLTIVGSIPITCAIPLFTLYMNTLKWAVNFANASLYMLTNAALGLVVLAGVRFCHQTFSTGIWLCRLPTLSRQSNLSLDGWLSVSKSNPLSLSIHDVPCKKLLFLYLELAAAYVFQTIGIICIIMMCIAKLVPEPEAVFGMSGLAIVFWIGQLIRRHVAKQSLAGARADQVAEPIVYLRAFKEDGPLLEREGMLNPLSKEEQIVAALKAAKRRVVALGRPGERLPPIGADRFYVENSEWQQVISDWVSKSHAIIMMAADTEATSWELGEVFRAKAMQRFMILLLDTKEGSLTQVVRLTLDRLRSLGIELNEELIEKKDFEEKKLRPLFRSANAFSEQLIAIRFAIDGSPIFIVADKMDTASIGEAIKWHFSELSAHGSAN